jgi:tetratricopeptide (TPR) repeat protein
MPNYLLTATSPSGDRISKLVSADSAEAAAANLEGEGWSEVTLHTDDVGAEVTVHPDETGALTAADHIKLRDQAQSGWGYFLFMVVFLYRQMLLIALGSTAIVALNIFRNGRLSLSGYLALAALAAPIGIAAVISIFGKSNRYNAMLESYAWGRWQDVLDQLPRIRGTGKPQIEFDLDVRQAAALAGLGRLDEGLKLIEPHEASEDVARWMYFARLTEVYSIGREFDRAIAASALALDHDPENATLLLGYAQQLLQNQQDLERAKDLIQQAEQQRLSDVLQALLPSIQGLAALNEGRYRQAIELVGLSQERLQKWRQLPPIGQAIDTNHGYLAIAYAHLRDATKTSEHWRLAEPRLRATKSRIVDRYIAASRHLAPFADARTPARS